MSKPITNEQLGLRVRLASRDAELIAYSRELIARSMELLRQPVLSTFLGKPTKSRRTIAVAQILEVPSLV